MQFVVGTPGGRTMNAYESKEYPMRTSAIACAVLAGTFGFGTLASAQDWRGGHRDGDQRSEQRHDRQDRRDNDRNWRQERRDDRNWNHNNNNYQQRGYVYNQPRYYSQPSYAYTAPQYYGHTQRYYRGGYLPRQYLAGNYYVNNWQAYPGLYAPPYGYQWVDTGSDFVLVALATGLIANLLTR
jgi:Ni/Co efflux regulator RcnB